LGFDPFGFFDCGGGGETLGTSGSISFGGKMATETGFEASFVFINFAFLRNLLNPPLQ
jgi:hypothetical protein